MNIKNKHLVAIIAGIVIGITLLLFFVSGIGEKTSIDYVSLLFVLLAEMVGFGFWAFSGKISGFVSLGTAPVIATYVIISLIFSVFFKGFFQDNITGFVTVHVVVLALATIVVLLNGKVTSVAENTDRETLIKRAVIDECETKAEILLNSGRFPNHAKKLERIYEEIKYSDHISDVKSREILIVLENISLSYDDVDIDKNCDNALALIAERNAIVKQMKRGSL